MNRGFSQADHIEGGRDAILDRWARGEQARQIGEALGLGGNVVIGVVYRARKAGDPRAAERGNPVPGARPAAPPKPRPSRAGAARPPRAASPARPATAKPAPPPRSPAMLALFGAQVRHASQGREIEGRREPTAPPARLAPLGPLTGGCRWPMWGDERPTQVFCDAPREGCAAPYCATHMARAYDRAAAPPRDVLEDAA